MLGDVGRSTRPTDRAIRSRSGQLLTIVGLVVLAGLFLPSSLGVVGDLRPDDHVCCGRGQEPHRTRGGLSDRPGATNTAGLAFRWLGGRCWSCPPSCVPRWPTSEADWNTRWQSRSQNSCFEMGISTASLVGSPLVLCQKCCERARSSRSRTEYNQGRGIGPQGTTPGSGLERPAQGRTPWCS